MWTQTSKIYAEVSLIKHFNGKKKKTVMSYSSHLSELAQKVLEYSTVGKLVKKKNRFQN